MIDFQLADKKSCIVERDGNRLVDLKLKKSSITNKFEIITGFIKKLSEYHRKYFDNWFEDFLVSCCNNESDRFHIMDSNQTFPSNLECQFYFTISMKIKKKDQ